MAGAGARYHKCGHRVWLYHRPGQGACFASLESQQAITHCPACRGMLREMDLSVEKPDTPQILTLPRGGRQ